MAIELGQPITELCQKLGNFPVTFISNKTAIQQLTDSVLAGRPFLASDIELIKSRLPSGVVLCKDPTAGQPLELWLETGESGGEEWPFTLTFEVELSFSSFESISEPGKLWRQNLKYATYQYTPTSGWGPMYWQGENPPLGIIGSTECGDMFEGWATVEFNEPVWQSWLDYYEWEHLPFNERPPFPPDILPGDFYLVTMGCTGADTVTTNSNSFSSRTVQCLLSPNVEFHGYSMSYSVNHIWILEVPK